MGGKEEMKVMTEGWKEGKMGESKDGKEWKVPVSMMAMRTMRRRMKKDRKKGRKEGRRKRMK
jgi:hypothetical protein